MTIMIFKIIDRHLILMILIFDFHDFSSQILSLKLTSCYLKGILLRVVFRGGVSIKKGLPVKIKNNSVVTQVMRILASSNSSSLTLAPTKGMSLN